uniref:Bacterial transglutaminase-like N-terminal domain-containing protein n=1 Tax=Microcystis aeruginosa (strain PCC 7806) TaxID=267872 RepID=A8YJK8_MICA7|nr:unnamed protein product [Microcystis aeruginosa PCC 7806]
MRYHIRHQTNYLYNQPVILSPHLLRLRPKSDGELMVGKLCESSRSKLTQNL